MAEGDVNMNEAVKSLQATTLAQMGANQALLSDFQARTFLRLEAQLDPIDAAVAGEIRASGLPSHVAGLNAGSQMPAPTLTGKTG